MRIKQISANISRREAVKKIGIGVVAGTGISQVGLGALPPETKVEISSKMPDSEWSQIRGFNYHPSYGSNGFELWQKFDKETITVELARGKRLFPQMNAIRWWHSWDSFLRDPKRYACEFDITLEIAEKLGCKVLPCLFNRWHSSCLDFGGIYIDHFLPKASWVQSTKMFDAFLEALVGRHKDDPRIIAWDLCNEPYAFSWRDFPDIVKTETVWLKSLYNKCKELGAQAPITVGIWPGVPLEMVDSISDILSIHPYWKPQESREEYEESLNRDVAFALEKGKPLLATETCWGNPDDKVRTEIIHFTLTHLSQRNIGFMPYLLHHSLTDCAHRLEYGPLLDDNRFEFIEADGRLRSGHEVFNEF